MNEEIKTFEYHFQDNSDIEGSVLSAASEHYAKGNYEEALKLLLNATHTSSDSNLYADIGTCYYKLNNTKEAESYWNKAISLDPKNARAYSNLGNLYYKKDQVEKAISHWLVALITKPEDANTCLNLAVAFNSKNMRFESIKYYERYLKYEENRTSTTYLQIKKTMENCVNVANQYLAYGIKFQSEDVPERAAQCYFKSLANYPNFSKTNLNLGSIFFADKNYELALKYWKASSHIDPNYDKIYSNIAITYDLMKQFDYAYCYYYRYMDYVMSNKEEYDKVNRRILKIKPFLNDHQDLIDVHLEKSKEHMANSEFYEAIDELKNYYILKPEEKDAFKDLIKKLESYLNPEKNIIATCFELGNNLVQENKFSEAKLYFARAMKLSSPQHLEFSKARAKFSQCEKAESGLY